MVNGHAGHMQVTKITLFIKIWRISKIMNQTRENVFKQNLWTGSLPGKLSINCGTIFEISKKLQKYAIPKIKMSHDLSCLENEVQAAVPLKLHCKSYNIFIFGIVLYLPHNNVLRLNPQLLKTQTVLEDFKFRLCFKTSFFVSVRKNWRCQVIFGD